MKIKLRKITIVLFILCFVFLFGCNSRKSEDEIARNLVEVNAKVELPKDSKIIYHLRDKEEKGFVHGGSFQYTVFQLESEPTDWLNVSSFENSLDEDKCKRFELFFLSALSEMPDGLGEIPQEFLPNFNERFYYLKTDDVYFVYLPQDLLLFTIIPND